MKGKGWLNSFYGRLEIQDGGAYSLPRRRRRLLLRDVLDHEELPIRTRLLRQSSLNVFMIVRLILGAFL